MPLLFFFLALALSLDGLGVGVAYGLRQIKIPLASMVVISMLSMLFVAMSMAAGQQLAAYISPEASRWLGGLILVAVGLWQISHMGKETGAEQEGRGFQAQDVKESSTIHISIRFLGVVIRILVEPVRADLDRSGVISVKEAFFLGAALAMDALVAGFGAALAGFSVFLVPPLVGLTQIFTVSLGGYLGRRYAPRRLGSRASLLPGIFLVALGLFKALKA